MDGSFSVHVYWAFFFLLSKGITFQYLELSFCCCFFPLAEQVTNNLKELAQQVTPGDIVSTYGVRKAMGISVPSPVIGNNLVDLTAGACPVSLEKGGRGNISLLPPATSARCCL